LEPITILCLLRFTEAQLNKLRAVSPRLLVEQRTNATLAEIPAELRQRVEILYGNNETFQEAHHFPQINWLQAHSAGVDYLQDKPIWHSEALITTLSGVHATPMAEHALAMMLAFRWNLSLMGRLQQQAQWPHDRWALFARPELRGSTLGLVGYGAVGRELARLAHELGMRVLAANRSGRRQPYRGFSEPGIGDPEASIPAEIYATTHLLKMLPQCDYVVGVAPLTPETHHLFNATAFAQMKNSAYFFNLSRGGIVDELALVDALRQGQIAGAGLDVFEAEPLPLESPLWQMDAERVIISPHVSGYTPLYDDRATDLFAENLRRYLAGESLLNLVERERGY
jgi:phosphoglycerate dehydrogenase-like enzyme